MIYYEIIYILYIEYKFHQFLSKNIIRVKYAIKNYMNRLYMIYSVINCKTYYLHGTYFEECFFNI